MATPVAPNKPPLIAHVIYRLDFGGLENGLVNLINHLPVERFRHAIICLTDYTNFYHRIRRPDVAVYALDKRPGQDLNWLLQLWRLLRKIQPTILHTRNLNALEGQLPGLLAGVRHRIHSEHGRDVDDVHGNHPSYTLLRRFFRPLVHTYIPMSRDLEHWLRARIRVPANKIVQIYNGVDMERFHPPAATRPCLLPEGFAPPDAIVIGSVGRLQPIKDQLTLVKAFIRLVAMRPRERSRLRLLIVGDGALRADLSTLLETAKLTELAWLPGSRDDIPEILRCLDLFVLPSINEGISNTILEAMASGLPVIATQVGGNPELVVDGVTGRLVLKQEPDAMATAIAEYLDKPELRRQHGSMGRERCLQRFSLGRMVGDYLGVYDACLGSRLE